MIDVAQFQYVTDLHKGCQRVHAIKVWKERLASSIHGWGIQGSGTRY
jgi:hypothetical protein